MGGTRDKAAGAIDRRLLDFLRADGHIPIRTLAKRTGIPPTTVRDHVRRLQERGIILGFRVELDARMIGIPLQAMVLAQYNLDRADATLAALARHPAVLASYTRPDQTDGCVLHIAASSTQHLTDVVDTLREEMDLHVHTLYLLDPLYPDAEAADDPPREGKDAGPKEG